MKKVGGMLVIWSVFVSGCGHEPRAVTDVDPSSKIPAIQLAVSKGDRTVIPQLVSDLNSDDPAVRLYASQGLQRLVGQDMGYRFYEEADQRRPAVDRWNRWLAMQPKR